MAVVNELSKKEPGRTRVVIIGAGFGGLAAARRLAEKPNVDVIIIDQRNHHLFQPLLYQVATAGLDPSQIAVPIRAVFASKEHVEVHLARVDRVDLAEAVVEGDSGKRLPFDYLILACGAQHSYAGHDWEGLAPGLKTSEQGIEIRRRLLLAFERAENELDPVEQQALLTFVVAGGGPTGVELAGAIADIGRTVLVKDFRRINPADARVILVHSGPRILPAYSERLSKHGQKDLEQLGVEVRVNQRVNDIDERGVVIGEERVEARTVFWAAGVEADQLTRTLGVETDHSGRVRVNKDLSVPGYGRVFVIGDAAYLEVDGHAVPGLAPAAMQEGRAAADNVLSSIAGRPTKAFRYLDKGTMATIGKRKAVASVFGLEFTGFVAWVAWLFVHILLLAGFRNRISVFFDWSWSYLFSRRGARLITSSQWRTTADLARPPDKPADLARPPDKPRASERTDGVQRPA